MHPRQRNKILFPSPHATPQPQPPCPHPPEVRRNRMLGVATRIVKTGLFIIGFLAVVCASVSAGPRIGISDEQMIAMYQQQLATRPNDPKLLLGLANSQLGARQYDAARKTAEQAAVIAPSDPEYLLRLAATLLHLGRTDAAIAQHERAIKLRPNFADAHFNLAVIYATAQPPNLALSRKFYSRALELGSEPDLTLEKLLK